MTLKGSGTLLQALTSGDKMVSILERRDKTYWRELRKTESFFCPLCKMRVEMRLGSKRRWHFAHTRRSNCASGIKGESSVHLQGKEDLYLFAKKELKVKLEHYLPHSKQRPDIFLESPPHTALEFQCATISVSSIYKRNHLYLKQGITPFWILGANRLRRQGAQLFRIQQFEWYAIRKKGQEHILTYYDPGTKLLCLVRHLIALQSELVFGHLQLNPLKESSMAELFSPNPVSVSFEKSLHDYRQRKRRTLLYNRKFRLFLYTHQLTAPPEESGWPLRSQCYLQIPSFIWQSYFLLNYLQFIPLHTPFKTLQCEIAIKTIFHSFNQPLKSYCRLDIVVKQVTKEYLSLLCLFGTIIQLEPDIYKRIKESKQTLVNEEKWLKIWDQALQGKGKLLL
ncbi:competence protein CoiA [Shouchella patagoniensis]|uniref:competence protein CoiA n=1 Tax=Shouchella patagoniensis TaxID=228576 RepID=UPI0009950371|nr:competence protein CoiA family protein [Shouchella patagoniensis]